MISNRQYICSECQGEVELTYLAVDAPIAKYHCLSCGLVKRVPTRQPVPEIIKMKP